MRARLQIVGLACLAALGGACEGVTQVHDVYCASDSDCEDPAYPLCQLDQHTCIAGAPVTRPDLAMPQEELPDLAKGRTPVDATTRVVDLAMSSGCTMSSACADAVPLCAMGTCRACAGDSEDTLCAARNPSTPRCASGRCVACRSATASTDCPSIAPVCDSGTCRACRGSADCASGVCAADGSCVASANVINVDNMKCNGGKGADGSLAHPYCEARDALSALGGKTFVRLAGSGAPYANLSVMNDGVTVTLVGPGPGATPAATIMGGSHTGLFISGTNDTIGVDGLDIIGGNGRSDIYCSAPAGAKSSLRVVRASLHGGGDVGIFARRCDLTVDRSRIGPDNEGGGVSIQGASYAITNTFIAGNIDGAAVTLSDDATGVFAHNTVFGNVNLAGVGGIECGMGAPKAITASIVWLNDKMGGSQLSGACAVTTSDLDETVAGTGNQMLAPNFVDDVSYDLHLDATKDNSCCVDKVPTSMVDHDIDGAHRPRGAAWDIGAHELK